MAEITTFVHMQVWYRSYEPTKRVSAISNSSFSRKWKYTLGPKNHDFKGARAVFNFKKWNTRPQQVPIKFIPAFRVPSEASILLLWASGGNFWTSWRLKPWRQRKMAFDDGKFPVGFSDHVWCHSSRPWTHSPLSRECKYDKVLIMTFWDFQQFPMSISRDIVISKTYWIIGTSPCMDGMSANYRGQLLWSIGLNLVM